MENEAPLPRPIDNGQVDQTVVEYIGDRLGAVRYRGPSGREYRFSALTSGRKRYVLAEDLDYFRGLVHFRVLDERRIDPEAEKLKAMEAAIGDRLVKEATRVLRPGGTDKRKRAAQRRGGRPAGRGFGAMLDCWMTCGRVGEYYGTAREAYDAIYDYLTQRTKAGRHVPPRERFPAVRSDAKRKREKIARQLSPVGTTLRGRSRGQSHTAVIVEAKDRPAGKAVKYGDQLFPSLSAAAKAVTGHPTNGWLFWRAGETSEQ